MEQLQLAASTQFCLQARDAEGKLVAVKALSLQSMSDWKQLDLFQREANTLKQLQHPGIPQYVADFEDDTEKDRGYYLVQASSCLAKLVSANSHWLHCHSSSCVPVLQYLVCIANLAVGNKNAWTCSLILLPSHDNTCMEMRTSFILFCMQDI